MGEKMTSEMQTECYRGAYGVFISISPFYGRWVGCQGDWGGVGTAVNVSGLGFRG